MIIFQMIQMKVKNLKTLRKIIKLYKNQKILFKIINKINKTIIMMYKKKRTHPKIQAAQIHFIIKLQNLKIVINKLRQKMKKTQRKIDLHQNLHLHLPAIQKIQNKKLRQMMLNNLHLHQVHHQDHQLTKIKRKKEKQNQKEKEKMQVKNKRKKSHVDQIHLQAVHQGHQALHQDYLLHQVLLQVVLPKKK